MTFFKRLFARPVKNEQPRAATPVSQYPRQLEHERVRGAHVVPFSWQKAIFAYLLQTGVTLWSNSVMWTHIDSLDSPYGFWMKLGLIGIIDLAGFWLVTLHLFGRAPLTRSYAIAAAILLMIVVLLHTGGVASYEGSKGEKLAQLNAIGQNLTRMIEAETRAKAEANSKAAIEANARGQVRLA